MEALEEAPIRRVYCPDGLGAGQESENESKQVLIEDAEDSEEELQTKPKENWVGSNVIQGNPVVPPANNLNKRFHPITHKEIPSAPWAKPEIPEELVRPASPQQILQERPASPQQQQILQEPSEKSQEQQQQQNQEQDQEQPQQNQEQEILPILEKSTINTSVKDLLLEREANRSDDNRLEKRIAGKVGVGRVMGDRGVKVNSEILGAEILLRQAQLDHLSGETKGMDRAFSGTIRHRPSPDITVSAGPSHEAAALKKLAKGITNQSQQSIAANLVADLSNTRDEMKEVPRLSGTALITETFNAVVEEVNEAKEKTKEFVDKAIPVLEKKTKISWKWYAGGTGLVAVSVVSAYIFGGQVVLGTLKETMILIKGIIKENMFKSISTSAAAIYYLVTGKHTKAWELLGKAFVKNLNEASEEELKPSERLEKERLEKERLEKERAELEREKERVKKELEREKERVQKEAEELKKQQEDFIKAQKAAGAFNRYVPGKYSLFGNITRKSHENKDKDINNETK